MKSSAEKGGDKVCDPNNLHTDIHTEAEQQEKPKIGTKGITRLARFTSASKRHWSSMYLSI